MDNYQKHIKATKKQLKNDLSNYLRNENYNGWFGKLKKKLAPIKYAGKLEKIGHKRANEFGENTKQYKAEITEYIREITGLK